MGRSASDGRHRHRGRPGRYLFANLPAGVGSRAGELFRRQRESADRRRVLDHALADASSTLIESLKEAQEALDRVRNQTEKSDTALAQAGITAIATQGELMAALAQLQAYQSAREAGASYERELARRQELERWAGVLRRSEQDFQQAQATRLTPCPIPEAQKSSSPSIPTTSSAQGRGIADAAAYASHDLLPDRSGMPRGFSIRFLQRAGGQWARPQFQPRAWRSGPAWPPS